MKQIILADVPLPSVYADQTVPIDSGDWFTIRMCGREPESRRRVSVEIAFSRPRALRQRAETFLTGWHAEAYDAVSEVLESDWVAELLGDANPLWRDRFGSGPLVISRLRRSYSLPQETSGNDFSTRLDNVGEVRGKVPSMPQMYWQTRDI